MEKRKTLTPKLRKQIFDRDNHQCRKCGKHSQQRKLQIHHIIPIIKNGSAAPENLITLCKECHHEWEHVIYANTSGVTFEQWLEFPTCALLLTTIANEDYWPDEMVSLKAVRQTIMKAHSTCREFQAYNMAS